MSTCTDDRTHADVAVDNVRRLLDGTLIKPAPWTLASDVHDWALRASASAFQSGRNFGRAEGRDEVHREVRAAAERAVRQAVKILGIKQ